MYKEEAETKKYKSSYNITSIFCSSRDSVSGTECTFCCKKTTVTIKSVTSSLRLSEVVVPAFVLLSHHHRRHRKNKEEKGVKQKVSESYNAFDDHISSLFENLNKECKEGRKRIVTMNPRKEQRMTGSCCYR